MKIRYKILSALGAMLPLPSTGWRLSSLTRPLANLSSTKPAPTRSGPFSIVATETGHMQIVFRRSVLIPVSTLQPRGFWLSGRCQQ